MPDFDELLDRANAIADKARDAGIDIDRCRADDTRIAVHQARDAVVALRTAAKDASALADDVLRAIPLGRTAADVLHRCRRVRELGTGSGYGAWSSGERLAVAVVLRDRDRLSQMGYSYQEAARYVYGGMVNPPAPEHFADWLAAIRLALDAPTPPR